MKKEKKIIEVVWCSGGGRLCWAGARVVGVSRRGDGVSLRLFVAVCGICVWWLVVWRCWPCLQHHVANASSIML